MPQDPSLHPPSRSFFNQWSLQPPGLQVRGRSSHSSWPRTGHRCPPSGIWETRRTGSPSCPTILSTLLQQLGFCVQDTQEMPLPRPAGMGDPLFPRMGALPGLSRDTGSYVKSSDLGSSTSQDGRDQGAEIGQRGSPRTASPPTQATPGCLPGPSPALAPRGALCQLRGELCVTRVTVTLCLELCSPLTKGGSTAQQRLGRGAEAPPLSWTQGASAVDRGPGSVRPDFLSLLKRWLHYKVLKITSTAWNQPRPLPSLPVSSGSADRTFPPRTSRPLKAPKSREGPSNPPGDDFPPMCT